MINLAQKDIQYKLGTFIITAVGVGMLLGIVLIMIGVYRGMIVDAEVLLDDLNVDLWIVQENTLGPFAESSRIHEDLKNSIKTIDGIEKIAGLTFQNLQLHNSKKSVRIMAVGFDPYGDFNPINPKRVIKGRGLNRSHYEIVVSDNIGFSLGEEIPIGRNSYKVVGITHGTVSSGGDPLVYISLKDAQELQFSYSNNRIRNDRARGIKDSSTNMPMVNAIIATIKEGYNINTVAKNIKETKHKSVYTKNAQKDILTKNLIERASKQIGLFTAILIIVSTIIIALIIYTMTLEKIKEISIMKLIGIPNSMIIKMIVQETIILGFLAFISGNIFSHLIYSKFPKRVVLEVSDALILFIIIIIASIVSSLVGIKKVINADPAAAIGG
ncbi:ABC transporter permease [Hydrogenimonas thermophila]|uniref:Putative ABC transport system permease protein n=1 Tax=Hydrogenimonas thermophila TaxID=223786 RepID=A0A1I5U9J1_9BACT|nr:ABC transporter permease [Hydrogenimonas thermophila]WOE70005.1 ABC transporter permease [Hydrogenimonas thermophila]WOE72522.1 ABC transporter permease [Hydrogenimonas thermophila]SFP91912.1 putative ABC transport system permease protein [Hydrogenimonas thermophila]